MSLSSRRAWIEIPSQWSSALVKYVALLTESVDWNIKANGAWKTKAVALLTESVDWNQALMEMAQLQ